MVALNNELNLINPSMKLRRKDDMQKSFKKVFEIDFESSETQNMMNRFKYMFQGLDENTIKNAIVSEFGKEFPLLEKKLAEKLF